VNLPDKTGFAHDGIIRWMSKAFVRDTGADEDDDLEVPEIAGVRNYITPAGHRRLKEELLQLLNTDRPAVVQTVSWAASNGDRSENGDYIYGKKRLREIDRRIRFLTKRLEAAEIVDPACREPTDQIFFGATVCYAGADGKKNQITIVGIDEVDPARGAISWISPMASALIKARIGDLVTLRAPAGIETLEILDVDYARS